MTDKLKREMTAAVDRLNDRGVPPTIQLHAPDEAVVGAKLFEAYQLTRIDALEVGPPLSMLKRLIRRFVRPVLSRQSAYNQAIADTVSELNHQFMLSRRELGVVDDMVDHQRRSTAVHLATLETQVDDIRHGSLANLSSQVADLVAGLDEQRDQRLELALTQRELMNQVQLLQRALESLTEDLRRTGAAPDLRGAERPNMTSPYDERTYEAFEEAFRGPQSLVADRLRPYLVDLADLKGGTLPVVDLGSGRGEWLRILREAEIPAVGFDTNEHFSEEARSDGLKVEIGDAVELLSALPPRSLGAVTAFQLIERLSVNEISSLIGAAFVALTPGGALILETPNASNLRVGASSFYKDPTHVRPVHPDWLTFLVTHHGFVGVETRYLHPAAEYDDFPSGSVNEGATPRGPLLEDLRWALYGPQDFAVVARKPRPPAT